MTQRTLPLLGVLALVVLAGCAGLPTVNNPLDSTNTQPDTTAGQIEYAMENAQSVETRATTIQNITIRDNDSTIRDLRQQQVQTQYNFTNNQYVALGSGRQLFLNNTVSFQFERYQDNTTQYEKRANSAKNETPDWTTTQVSYTPREQFATLANKSFLQHFNATTNNSTIRYQIDLLNNSSAVEELPGNSVTQMDTFRPVLDVYVAEIYVNASTHQFEEVRVYAYGDLNQSDLEQLDDRYKTQTDGQGEGVIEYATEIEYRAYNTSTNITIPENATET